MARQVKRKDERKLQAERVKCSNCPLRKAETFREFTTEEATYMADFKTGELDVDAGATLFLEGSHSAHLYTMFDGWAFRYKMLEDGRRQILNFVLPGDLVGLQGSLMKEMQHSVEALSKAKLCVFERTRLMDLFNRHPSLGYDITWMASREERLLDENLLSVGRRSALERSAYLLALLDERARQTGMAGKNTQLLLPLTQLHVADTLGLSVVHTNKTLRKLADRKLIRWLDRSCEVLDSEGLKEIAGWDSPPEVRRPFL